METKICSKCKEEKNVNEFGKRKNRKCNLTSQCKTCLSKNQKIYRETHFEEIKKRKKLYYDANSEYLKQKRKDWYKNNIDYARNQKREYIKNHRDILLEKAKEYSKNNRAKINARIRKTRKENLLFRLKENVRRRVNQYISKNGYNKTSKIFDIIGCSPEKLKAYIEKQFTIDMSWENYGLKGWHIDHIIPLDSAKTENELYQLCHYTNLQPLWGGDNIRKGAIII